MDTKTMFLVAAIAITSLLVVASVMSVYQASARPQQAHLPNPTAVEHACGNSNTEHAPPICRHR